MATWLSQIEGSGSGIKMVPNYVAPDLAAQIRRHVSNSIRLRKGSIRCYFVTDITTFEGLLDREAQQQLEGGEHPALNWSLEVTE